MYRVLSPGGFAVLMFPIIEAWTETYEDPRYQGTPEDRIAHYAQDDHIKYFGRDVRDHIRAAGFGLDEFVAEGPDSARYALMRGKTTFVAQKAVRWGAARKGTAWILDIRQARICIRDVGKRTRRNKGTNRDNDRTA